MVIHETKKIKRLCVCSFTFSATTEKKEEKKTTIRDYHYYLLTQ